MAIADGFYVFEPTDLQGNSLGRFGPYDFAFTRDFLRGLCEHLDHKQVEHALAVTQLNASVPYDLSDVRELHGQETIAWSARLTWYLRQ